MIDFFAQTGVSNHEIVGYGGAGAVLIVVLGTIKDLGKEWIMNRTKLGKNIKNGSGCKMTQEAVDVILEKDGEGRRMSHFPMADIRRQHQEQADAMKEISQTLLKAATILEGMRK